MYIKFLVKSRWVFAPLSRITLSVILGSTPRMTEREVHYKITQRRVFLGLPDAIAHHRLAATLIGRPPSGCVVSFCTGHGLIVPAMSKRKRCSKIARAMMASCRAKLAPMQTRGPAP